MEEKAKEILEKFLPPKELWPQFKIPEEYEKLPSEINLAEEILTKAIEEGKKNKVAIYYEDQKITYREIDVLSNKLASSLVELGLEPYDRVALRFRNAPEGVIANFAVLKAGGIPVTMHPRWSRHEIKHVANDCKAKFIITQIYPDVIGEIEAVKDEIPVKNIIACGDEEKTKEKGYIAYEELIKKGKKDFEPVRKSKDAPAVLLYTSGTTGPPKGCAHFPAGILAEIDAVGREVWKFTEDDVLGTPAPMTFALGYGALCMIPYRFGISASVMARPDPEYVFSMIEKHGVTVLSILPTWYRKVLPILDKLMEKYDISSVRMFTGGGEALGADTAVKWAEKTGKMVLEGFGATEFFYIVMSNSIPEKPKAGSLGKPLSVFEIKVYNPETKEMAERGEGVMLLRGPTGTVYWNPYDYNQKLYKKMKEEIIEGYVSLGDTVEIDDEGYVWYRGKGEDIIKSSGYRIGADEIETAIKEHEAVDDAGVVGAPHPVRGEDVVAFVVLKQGYKGDEEMKKKLLEFLSTKIAKYKLPREIFFVDSLPRHTTGKLLRRELKKLAQEMYKPKD